MELKSILHPTDFSDSARRAFERAVALSRQTGAELHLLHVTETFGEDPIRGAFDSRLDEHAFHSTALERADRLVQELQAEAEASGVRVKRIHSHGQIPSQVILDYASDQKPDVIVLGTHGRRGFRRMVAGSVAMDVVRRAIGPVITVPSRSNPLAEKAFARILVPIDFSMHARTALGCARWLAHELGSELHVLHVIEKPVFPAFYDASVEMMYGNAESMIEEARLELVHVTESVDDLDLPYTSEVVQGHAIEAILETASRLKSDLIVLSTHGLTGVSRFFLGSVSERVIRMATVPTLRLRTVTADDDPTWAAPDEATTRGSGP
jgi:nucleotide-binding universal stress UspA family protein